MKKRTKDTSSVDRFLAFFQETSSKGQQMFSAPPPKEAFEVWWRKEFGGRMKGSKHIGRRAWYAALREMGCNET